MLDTVRQFLEHEVPAAVRRWLSLAAVPKDASLVDGTQITATSVGTDDRQRWADELWGAVVAALDSLLRSHYHIVEFSDQPTCVLRIGRMEAARSVLLSDGTSIRTGETIGTIHFWNERLPAFPRSGPNIHWAAEMHRRVAGSFVELARFVETDPDWQEMRAFLGEAALSSRIGDVQLRRVAHHFGLEAIEAPPSIFRQLHEFGECFSAWALARAYNPNALPRRRFFQRHQELWISRTALLGRYGKLHKPDGARPPTGDRGVRQW